MATDPSNTADVIRLPDEVTHVLQEPSAASRRIVRGHAPVPAICGECGVELIHKTH